MPGQLKPRAKCPCCGEPLDALVDESRCEAGNVIVRRVYYHGKTGNRRRPRPCRKVFEDHDAAILEREKLEVKCPAI